MLGSRREFLAFRVCRHFSLDESLEVLGRHDPADAHLEIAGQRGVDQVGTSKQVEQLDCICTPRSIRDPTVSTLAI
jgi:hypothetical protein